MYALIIRKVILSGKAVTAYFKITSYMYFSFIILIAAGKFEMSTSIPLIFISYLFV